MDMPAKKDVKAKGKEPEGETKDPEDKRDPCIYCGQKIDPVVMEQQQIKTKMPLPKRQWALIVAEQANINDCDVAAERIKLKIMKKTNEFARAHRIGFLMGLGVEVEPPIKDEDGKKGVNHQWEFFYVDPVVQTKKHYLDVNLTKTEEDVIRDLWWDYSSELEKTQEASMEYFAVLTEVAKSCSWGFRPLRVDQGHFISQSAVEERVKEAVKKAEEKAKKEYEEKEKKKQG